MIPREEVEERFASLEKEIIKGFDQTLEDVEEVKKKCEGFERLSERVKMLETIVSLLKDTVDELKRVRKEEEELEDNRRRRKKK